MTVRELINNDFIFFSLIVVLFVVSINGIAMFLDNLLSLGRNSRIIGYYLKKIFILFFTYLFKLIFFPITIFFWIKEYRSINELIINNSRLKKYDN